VKPTPELRWQKRTADRNPTTGRPLYGAVWYEVLQQLWVAEQEGERIGEWRDVPVVEETV
jgi:hypothetical protein